ncbi:MAG TPA: hypothetical protein QF353_06645 [Gammaproteobacteria bacterium]|nr:hypothetical protein [Gammaproteobacteria bacterium]
MEVIKYALITLLITIMGTGGASIWDPTTRPKKDINHNVSPKQLSLEMVYISNGHKVAIINGEGYSEGDYIGASRVQHIELNSIILISKNKTYHLQIDSTSPQMNIIHEDNKGQKTSSLKSSSKRTPRKQT